MKSHRDRLSLIGPISKGQDLKNAHMLLKSHYDSIWDSQWHNESLNFNINQKDEIVFNQSKVPTKIASWKQFIM